MARRKKQENRYLLIGLGIYFTLAFILEYPWILGICLLSGIIALILFISAKSKKNKFEVYNMAYIDQMNPFQFEEYICNLFKQLGYNDSYCTLKSGDFGADVIAQSGYEKIAIQVEKYKKNKRYWYKSSPRNLSSKKLCLYYHASKGIVLTTSYFTKSAKELAKQCHVELIDRDMFIQLLQN